jgi:antitoxin component of MazEF toxin-antitoxin module
MRALQKLTTRGNSTGVSIPRVLLHRLGWLPGESVILELLEDDSVRVRRPVERDFAPLGAPRLVMTDLVTGGR